MADVLEKLATRTWPWMAGAVILVGAFMLWLYAASSSIGGGSAADDRTAALPAVADTSFAANPERFSRRRILLSGVKVEELLGRAALTLDLPDRPGYPVILDRPVVEQEINVVVGDNLALAGWVFALNDSLVDVYAQRGLFELENRERLEGQSTFFLADSLDFVIPAGETRPEGDGQR